MKPPRSTIGRLMATVGIVALNLGAARLAFAIDPWVLAGTAPDLVLIHDAARPFVSPESIRAGIAAAERHGAATVAVPAVDTVLMGDSDAFLVGTPDRSSLWCCQTPQIFRVGVIREAHRRAAEEGRRGTDDASLVREAGMPVKLVIGAALNFKITTPFDLEVARMVVREGLAC